MELKILGHIPLDQLERKPKKRNPETYAMEVRGQMKSLAESVNERFGDIIDSDGRIKITDKDDARYVAIKEEAWAKEKGMSLEEYRRKQESSTSSLAEQAVTLSLAKVLGSRFLSLRSSAWDDYENGVDNLLVDTETGSLVCGFDEVIEGYGQNGQDKKEEKIMKKFAKGGAYAKYGLKVSPENKNDIKIGKQENLPTFFISINKDELSDLLENVSKKEISDVEKKVLKDLVSSLEYQLGKMTDSNIRIPENLNKNLLKAKDLVDILKEKI